MNRRTFFNSIARVAAAASLSPNIFIPKFEPVKWKVTRPGYYRFILNPEWVNAPYEFGYHMHESIGRFAPPPGFFANMPERMFPYRFNSPDTDPIPPVLKIWQPAGVDILHPSDSV